MVVWVVHYLDFVILGLIFTNMHLKQNVHDIIKYKVNFGIMQQIFDEIVHLLIRLSTGQEIVN